eukprot:4984415-Prymnesium_polylepis.3
MGWWWASHKRRDGPGRLGSCNLAERTYDTSSAEQFRDSHTLCLRWLKVCGPIAAVSRFSLSHHPVPESPGSRSHERAELRALLYDVTLRVTVLRTVTIEDCPQWHSASAAATVVGTCEAATAARAARLAAVARRAVISSACHTDRMATSNARANWRRLSMGATRPQRSVVRCRAIAILRFMRAEDDWHHSAPSVTTCEVDPYATNALHCNTDHCCSRIIEHMAR